MKNVIYANFSLSHPYSKITVVMQTFEQGDFYRILSCGLYVHVLCEKKYSEKF